MLLLVQLQLLLHATNPLALERKSANLVERTSLAPATNFCQRGYKDLPCKMTKK